MRWPRDDRGRPAWRSQLALLMAAALLLAAHGLRAQTVRIRLRNASPQQAADELARVLRAPVEVRGGAGRTVTIDLLTVAPGIALDRVSALLGGTWKRVLEVRPGEREPGWVPPLLERNLVTGFRDFPTHRALALLARELRAELDAPEELPGRITLLARNEPATAVLDALCSQAGLTWRLRYVIESQDLPEPVIPPPPRVSPRPDPPRTEPAPLLPPVPPPRSAPTGAGLREELGEVILSISRAAPTDRERSVLEAIAAFEEMDRELRSFSTSERASLLDSARPVLSRWRALYRGLAPKVQKQLRPAHQALERLFH